MTPFPQTVMRIRQYLRSRLGWDMEYLGKPSGTGPDGPLPMPDLKPAPDYTTCARSGANPLSPEDFVSQIRKLSRAGLRKEHADRADFLNPL